MTHTVVRFNAELLVHRVHEPVPCAGAVAVREKPWPHAHIDLGTVLVVRRCALNDGHDGPHNHAGGSSSPFTLCGLTLTDDPWINWTPSDDDPRCPVCHGITADAQEALL